MLGPARGRLASRCALGARWHAGAPTIASGVRCVAGTSAANHAGDGAAQRAIDEAGLSPFRFQQWTGKRLTRSYGWSYDFQTGAFAPADPIPDWLLDVRTRSASYAGLEPDDLVQALLIRYDPGAGIGWHKDRPVFEHVIGVSLGHPATLRLPHQDVALA